MSDQLLSTDPAAGRLLSSDPAAGITPTFRSENETDAQGHSVVAGVKDFLGELKSLNPVEINRFVQSAFWHPIDTGKQILSAQDQMRVQAHDAFKKGDWQTGVARTIEWLLPFVGPRLAQSGDYFQKGQYAKGAGAAVDVAAPAILSAGAAELPALKAAIGPLVKSKLTPEEAASNAFAAERGIPLDAATATGSRTARAMQKRVQNTMGGEATADQLLADQQAGLTRTGQRLADAVNGTEAPTTQAGVTEVQPGPRVSPEEAGTAVRSSIQKFTGDLNAQATDAYDRLRAIEEQPEHQQTIHTAPEGSPKYSQILGKLSRGWKSTDTPVDAGTAEGATVAVKPSRAELVVMRQIEAEMDANPYQRGRMVQDDLDSSDTHWARGSANASVYHDLHSEMGYLDTEGSGPPGHEMLNDIRHTLETGEWNAASKAAYRVAQQRLRKGTGSLTGPNLPQGAPILGTSETVNLPVDLRVTKRALQPLYDRLKRESELIPLQGDKGRALVALDRLIGGPDHAPLSTVDQALGDLKSMARADIPELRTQGQGLAAAAVKQLDHAVRQTAQRAGPDAVAALEQGRAATVAKYQVGDVLEQLSPEGVQAYRSLTSKGDAGIGKLRKVAEYAPDEVPKVARALLQDLLDTATERGRFDHADRLYAEWQKYGPETKKTLFPADGQVQALDRFFLLAKRIAENPNPSGTAHVNNVFNWVSQPGMYAAAKLLYTPKGVAALTRQLTLASSRMRIPSTWQGYAGILNAAREAGVNLQALPAAADQDSQATR